MKSLLLDRSTWDFCLDAEGNIATCSEPYSVLQDVATALRTWAGECWYDTTLGLPFISDIFNGPDQIAMLKASSENTASSVAGVASAQCVVLGPNSRTRTVGGVILVTFANGETQSVNF